MKAKLRVLCLSLIVVFGTLNLAGCVRDKYIRNKQVFAHLEPLEIRGQEMTTISPDNLIEETEKEDILTEKDIFCVENLIDEIPYIEVNGNVPQFTEKDKVRIDVFETYSKLDSLKRCGTAYANICMDLMPSEERGEIGQVKPSGWNQEKYDGIVDSNPPYLYNRCHLIAYQLSGENANERNLITGTRFLNVKEMLPWEDKVADYVKETGNHVLYRVTPIFIQEEMLCRGVLMEAFSVEDNGKGVSFSIFCPNVQPGVTIDYETGESCLNYELQENYADISREYILNTRTMKYHFPTCNSIDNISPKNKEKYIGFCKELMNKGYKACKLCIPQ